MKHLQQNERHSITRETAYEMEELIMKYLWICRRLVWYRKRNEIEDDEGGGASHTCGQTEMHMEILRRKYGDRLDWTTLAYTRDNIKIITQRCILPTILIVTGHCCRCRLLSLIRTLNRFDERAKTWINLAQHRDK
jgi:hypothetical protein